MIAVASTSSFSVWTHSVGALLVVIMTEVFSWRELTRLKNEADSSFFTGNNMISSMASRSAYSHLLYVVRADMDMSLVLRQVRMSSMEIM